MGVPDWRLAKVPSGSTARSENITVPTLCAVPRSMYRMPLNAASSAPVKEAYDATIALALAAQAAGRLDGAAVRDRLRAVGGAPGTV